MFGIRSWIIFHTLFFVGCGASQPAPTTTTTPSSGSQTDLLKGIVTVKPADTPETLAEKRTQLESNLKQAQQSAAQGDLDRAIQLLEDAVNLDFRHREVLLLLTQYSQSRSKALVTENPGRSYRLMVQSGGYLRMMRDAHHDFTPEERKIIANVLFDEACAHARANRQGEFSGSLREAIDAGFNDLERLQTEPDFDGFRKVPEMAKLIDDAANSVKTRATPPSP